MKNFLIILAVVLTNVFSVVATPVKNYKISNEIVASINKSKEDFKFFNDSIIMRDNMNFAPIYRYLELNDDQYEEFYEIHKDVYNSINKLAMKKENGKKAFNNHMLVDLRNSHYILDDKQYHKYLKVINVTLANRGLNKYLY